MGVAILRVPEGFCVDEDENDNDFQKPEEDTKLIGIFLLSLVSFHLTIHSLRKLFTDNFINSFTFLYNLGSIYRYQCFYVSWLAVSSHKDHYMSHVSSY